MEFYSAFSYHDKSSKMTIPAIHNIFFLDIAVVIILMITAYLSKRLGEALKKTAFYKLLYAASACILAAVVVNTFAANRLFSHLNNVMNTISIAMRFLAGLVSVFACLQYWKWLFSEIFKN